jgi:hypothetical protein
MANDHNIPIEYLRQCFDYDPATETLSWRERPREHFATTNAWAWWNTRFAGKPAGSPDKDGYLVVGLTFDGRLRKLRAHRVVWALERGYWPKHQIDHRDGVEAGDGVGNLREATQGEQNQNRKTSRNNRSGYPGVSPDKRSGKWLAMIGVAGRRLYLGLFNTADAAFFAVLDARVEHFTFEPTPRGLSEAAAAVEAAWWFDRRRWRAIV